MFPLYKSGNRTEKLNYRPISILSVFSKILEKIIKEQLAQYLEANNILCQCQYGFRSGKNISNALFNLNKDLNDSLSKNKKNLLIFLDIAKAFDSIDRRKLLQKLKLIGVTDNALNWFQSYLSNRQQFVEILNVKGNNCSIEYGVVQGSTLGPLLFLIYVNNLSKVNISGKLYLFADDTAVHVEGDTWQQVYEKATNDLAILKSWFDHNTLTLNIA